MWWVWIFVAAAVAGAVMLAVFGITLWRKARALLDALGELGAQLDCQSPKSTAQVPEVLCTDHAVPLTMTLRHPLQNSVSSRIRGYVRLKRSHADCRVMPSAAPILAQLIPRSRAMVTHARRCSSTCPPASATSRTRPSRASSPRELQAGFSGSKGSDSAEA